MNGFETMSGVALPASKTTACPGCHATIRLIAHAQSRYVACGSCGKLWDALQPEEWKQIRQFKLPNLSFLIPPGRKGLLRGIRYAVTGYIRWKDAGPDYFWNEYVLFNPVHGYAFLSEFNGHWNYTVTADTYPKVALSDRSFDFAGDSYRLFAKYRQTPIFAAGEFAWNINDNSPHIEEFIAPPYILIRERNSDYQQWFEGEYIEPNEIKRAFNIPGPFPEKTGVGSTQSPSITTSTDTLKTITVAALILLLVIQSLLVSLAREEVVYEDSFVIAQDWGTAKPIVSQPFVVKGENFNTSNLEFTLYSPVNDDWMEADITMINDQTGEEYQFEVGVEYYSGYEGGEHWTEGSRSASRFLSAIPDGKYHLNIFPAKGKMDQEPTFQLQVVRDVPMWSNFLLIALLALAYPALQWWRIYQFEQKRWMNSDYSPYA